MPDIAFIALGSNMGEPGLQLRLAAAHLRAISLQAGGSAGFAASSIWQSEPEGFQDEVETFCNAVVRLSFDGSAQQLLDLMQTLEVKLGKQAKAAASMGYASRTIDLDLIDFGGATLASPELQLPHPRAHLRRFVLLPLQEIDQNFSFPGIRKTLNQLIAEAPENPMINNGPLLLQEGA